MSAHHATRGIGTQSRKRALASASISALFALLGCREGVAPSADVTLDRSAPVDAVHDVGGDVGPDAPDLSGDVPAPPPEDVPTTVDVVADDARDGAADVSDVSVIRPTLALSPASTTVPVDGRESFVVTVGGSADEDVELSLREAGGGTVSPLGLYAAPSVPGVYHVVATLRADHAVSATATVTVRPLRHQLVVGPRVITAAPGAEVWFNAVSLDRRGALQWTVEESAGGTVDGYGRYRAPTATGTFHVRVTSVADPTLTDVATVRVIPAPAASLTLSGRAPAVVLTPPSLEQWLYVREATETRGYRTLNWTTDGPGAAVLHAYSEVTGEYPYDLAAVDLRAAPAEGVSLVSAADMADPRVTLSIPVVVQGDGAPRVVALRSGVRSGSTMTALSDGRVVIAGGRTLAVGSASQAVLSAIDVFDPLRGRVTRVAALNQGRYWHTATRLEDGTILFTGGRGILGQGPPLATAELFDPSTNEVTTVASLSAPRQMHLAQRLPSGGVLIAYGLGPSDAVLNFAEVYEPARRAFRVLSEPPTVNRAANARAVLLDGRVFTFGGVLGGDYPSNRAAPEVFDPSTERFTRLPVAPLTTSTFPTGRLCVAPLSAGRVLVTGIAQGVGTYASFPQAVIYDTRSNTVTALPASGFVARSYARAVVARSGRVFVIGGTYHTSYGNSAFSVRDIEEFDEARSQLVPFARMMSPVAGGITTDETDFAVALPDGRVVIADGVRMEPEWPWSGRTAPDADIALFSP